MKVVFAVVAFVFSLVSAAEEFDFISAKPIHRLIPANVLRDDPGFCFASTQCRLYNMNETWTLHPHCGVSTCVHDKQFGEQLLELVQDCQIPKPGFEKDCELAKGKFNESAAYPGCCPVYKCKKGTKIEFLEPVTVAPVIIEEVSTTKP